MVEVAGVGVSETHPLAAATKDGERRVPDGQGQRQHRHEQGQRHGHLGDSQDGDDPD